MTDQMDQSLFSLPGSPPNIFSREGAPILLSSGSGVPHGDFVFNVGPEEFMRIKADGTAIVRGELVAKNVEVYKAFVFWLAQATSPFFQTSQLGL